MRRINTRWAYTIRKKPGPKMKIDMTKYNLESKNFGDPLP